jgi:4-amino-4-deoxy-L-arabinose transferase-like glycosyltransferase
MSIEQIKKKINTIPYAILVFIFSVIYRLPSLGYDFLNNDLFLWMKRSYGFGSALTSFNFKETLVTYHPGVTLLWIQFVGNKLYTVFDSLKYKGSLNHFEIFLKTNYFQNLVLVFVTAFLVSFIYLALKSLIGKRLSLIVVILLMFEPFAIALSRTVHLDYISALFVALTLIFIYKSILQKDTSRIIKIKKFKVPVNTILSGLFLGLALLTKSSGLILIPFVMLLKVPDLIRTRSVRNLKYPFFIFLIAFITFILWWPSMWVNPIETINQYIFKGIKGVALEEGHSHIWFGRETLDPGPLFYPLAIASRLTPILVFLFLGGVIYLLKNKKKLDKELFNFVKYNYLFIFLYLIVITLSTKKLDRYFFPILVPFIITAVYYLPRIINMKKDYRYINIYNCF